MASWSRETFSESACVDSRSSDEAFSPRKINSCFGRPPISRVGPPW